MKCFFYCFILCCLLPNAGCLKFLILKKKELEEYAYYVKKAIQRPTSLDIQNVNLELYVNKIIDLYYNSLMDRLKRVPSIEPTVKRNFA